MSMLYAHASCETMRHARCYMGSHTDRLVCTRTYSIIFLRHMTPCLEASPLAAVISDSACVNSLARCSVLLRSRLRVRQLTMRIVATSRRDRNGFIDKLLSSHVNVPFCWRRRRRQDWQELHSCPLLLLRKTAESTSHTMKRSPMSLCTGCCGPERDCIKHRVFSTSRHPLGSKPLLEVPLEFALASAESGKSRIVGKDFGRQSGCIRGSSRWRADVPFQQTVRFSSILTAELNKKANARQCCLLTSRAGEHASL